MSNSVKQSVLVACRHLLKPVIKLLLHAGVTYRDFAEIGKRTYVEVAGDEFGLQGRKTNISRVSILTGIARKEVGRLRELAATEGEEFSGRMSPATRVMAGWHQEPSWQDNAGKPRQLSAEEILSLIEGYAGDIPASALLKELQKVGAIAQTKDGKFVALARSFVPGRFDHDSVRMLGAHLHDLGQSISFNLLEGDQKALRFQRVVSNEAINSPTLNRFRALVESRGEDFLEQLDDWLKSNEIADDSDRHPRYRTGVGIYFFEDKIKQDK